MVVNDDRILRTMVMADADAVARIGFEAWVEHRFYPEWFEPAVETRVCDSFRQFAENPQAEVVVCIVGGAVVGWGARDSREHPGDRARAWDYISDLWISPALQRRGIGSAILAELIARMRAESLETATIEVVEANERAHRLYQARGFQEIWRGEIVSEALGLPVRRILLERAID